MVARQPLGDSLGLSEMEESVKNSNIDRKSVREMATGVASENLEPGGVLTAAKDIASGNWILAAPYLASAYKNTQTAFKAGYEVLSGKPGEASCELANEALKLAVSAAAEGTNLVKRVFTSPKVFHDTLQQVFDSRVGAKEDFVKMSYQLGRIHKKDPKAKAHLNRWMAQLREAHESGDPHKLISVTRHVLRTATSRLKKLGVETKIPKHIEKLDTQIETPCAKKKRLKQEKGTRVDLPSSKKKNPDLVNSKPDQGPRKKVTQVKPQTYSDTPSKRKSSTKKKTATKSKKKTAVKSMSRSHSKHRHHSSKRRR